jgi:hypothetical protein
MDKDTPPKKNNTAVIICVLLLIIVAIIAAVFIGLYTKMAKMSDDDCPICEDCPDCPECKTDCAKCVQECDSCKDNPIDDCTKYREQCPQDCTKCPTNCGDCPQDCTKCPTNCADCPVNCDECSKKCSSLSCPINKPTNPAVNRGKKLRLNPGNCYLNVSSEGQLSVTSDPNQAIPWSYEPVSGANYGYIRAYINDRVLNIRRLGIPNQCNSISYIQMFWDPNGLYPELDGWEYDGVNFYSSYNTPDPNTRWMLSFTLQSGSDWQLLALTMVPVPNQIIGRATAGPFTLV